MNVKNLLRKISPLNDDEESSTKVYIIKKILAFFLIYGIGALVGEVIIIGILYLLGYLPLQGNMPEGKISVLLPYYGFLFFFLAAILYCKYIEKRDLKSLGFGKGLTDFWIGGMIAIVLLIVIIALCCIGNTIHYIGISKKLDGTYIMALFIGFLIQGIAEETMCRGFLMTALLKKTSPLIATLVSATAFTIPHLLSLLELELRYIIIGMANLYLISVIFSLMILKRSNIWISSGLHSVWNFVLYGILGLTVSGNDTYSECVFQFKVSSFNILNGGVYGIEAGFIVTIVLSVAIFVMFKLGCERSCTYGI